MIDRFLARLPRGPILLDAALGTRLIAMGLDLATDDPCRWTLNRPELIFDLHHRDITAGAEVVCTNSFGANREWLARWGQAQDVEAINRESVRIAREAAGPDRFVVGSIGPTATVNPATIREQADALLGAGADALVLETCRLDQALAGLKVLGRLERPTIVSLFDWPDPIAPTARQLAEAGAAVSGANCFGDLALGGRLLDAIATMDPMPCWLKPSGGLPGGVALNLEDFTALARRVALLPSPILLGGCCGTTEAHLAAIHAAWSVF